MNKFFQIKRNADGQWVVCSENVRSKGKSKSMVLAAVSAVSMFMATPAMADLAEGFAIGDKSVAVGQNSFATGIKSIAVGDNAVATGENLTATEIRNKLAENEQRLSAIETQKGVVATKERDFASKNAVFLRVQQADRQIAELRQTIDTQLAPALNTATTNYNDYLPTYEAKKQELNARMNSLATLSGFNIAQATTTEGITQIATELKAQAERGYENIVNNPVSYYEDYVRNYIAAKGDLTANKAWVEQTKLWEYAAPFPTYSLNSGYSTDRVFASPIPNLILFNKSLAGYKEIKSEGQFGVEISGGRVYFDVGPRDTLKSINSEEWQAIQNTLDENAVKVKQWFVDSNHHIGQDPSLRAEMERAIDLDTNTIKKRYEVKFWQGEYDRLGKSSTPEGLNALQKKVQAEEELKQLNDSDNAVDLIKRERDKWIKENITDIENMNTKFVNDFKANLTKMLQEEQRNHDDLLRLKNNAQAALDRVNRRIAQLEPSRADRATAEQAQPAYQELNRQKAELERMINELTLNDLRNIGSYAVAIGESRATGEKSLALGYQNFAVQSGTVAIGMNAQAQGRNDIVIGQGSSTPAHGENNILLGKNVSIADTADNPVKNSIGLGSDTVVSKEVASPTLVIGSTTYRTGGQAPVGTVSVGSSGKERTITHVAAGRITETSTDAVNGSQLHAVITELGKKTSVDLTNAINGVVKYDNTTQDTITLGGASGTTISNLKDGALSADSKEAVTGKQLFEVKNTAESAKTTAEQAARDIATLSNNAVKYDNDSKETLTLGGADGTTISNLKDGALSADSKEAVTGKQLFEVKNTAESAKTTAEQAARDIATLSNNAVKYDNDSKETLTLGGAGGTTISNLKDGTLSADSKEAVTGKQLFEVKNTAESAKTTAESAKTTAEQAARDIAALSNNAVKYDNTTQDTITLGGAGGTTISNLKDGTLSADSKEAVTGKQLFALSERVNSLPTPQSIVVTGEDGIQVGSQVVGNTKTFTLRLTGGQQQGIQYDNESKDTITLGGANGTVIDNLRSGEISETSSQAVTGQQLYQVTQSMNVLGSNVNARFNQVQQDIQKVRQESRLGAASAMAVASLPQAWKPDQSGVSASMADYGGEQAYAIGFSKMANTGKWVWKASMSVDKRNIGASTGVFFSLD